MVTTRFGSLWENGHWVGFTQVEGKEEWNWITNVTDPEMT